MSGDHQHAHGAGLPQRQLSIALLLTGTFLVVEVIGGLITGSLALLADAAHMFTDTAALAIALIAIRLAKRPADARRTFGYHRFEILAAAFNAGLLFAVALYVLYEAYRRFSDPPSIQTTGMLIVASVGLIVNLISMKLLQSGQGESLNVKGAYLEVLSDAIGSAGVIVGALVIRYTGWSWVDSLVAVAISVWIVPRTWLLLKASVNILLEGVPDGVEIEKVSAAILSVDGVRSIHDLHVWALTSGKASLTVHAVVDDGIDHYRVTLPAIRERLHDAFDIAHVTIQFELEPCTQATSTLHY
ncbi:cation diffusion facilitator family transporter [Schauerella aestuarii]|uniref:cation diffusion facilitator family transporter n=1 Tax=Schauerella aestuarii TaxID=2511204 RepID=UPI001370E7C2|nr:cation diffusion facilitator family transporter [Achromobacter aestuarii]MYZ42535.1 cation transporter [Achromobacter aestuarii]